MKWKLAYAHHKDCHKGIYTTITSAVTDADGNGDFCFVINGRRVCVLG